MELGMGEMNARAAAGRGIVEAMFGEDLIGNTSAHEGSGLAAVAGRLAVEQCYGDVWSREGLGLRERSLVTLGVLVAQRQPDELANHVRGALGNGMSADEIREAILQTLPYVGFPALATALTVTERALARYAPATESAGERT